MNKVEKILIGVFGVGTIPYFMQCIRKGMRYGFGSGMMRYFKSELITLHGALFALSVIGLITVFIVHAIIKRKKRSEVRITKADKIWFAISFLPVILASALRTVRCCDRCEIFMVELLWYRRLYVSCYLRRHTYPACTAPVYHLADNIPRNTA